MIAAHFNGGPLDDQYRTVERDPVYVYLPQRLRVPTSLEDDLSPIGPAPRTGEYRMRRNFVGDAVPHDAVGTVEFDFMMP